MASAVPLLSDDGAQQSGNNGFAPTNGSSPPTDRVDKVRVAVAGQNDGQDGEEAATVEPSKVLRLQSKRNFDEADEPEAATFSRQTSPEEHTDVVQFYASTWFCSEDEEDVEIFVMRIGEMTKPCSVGWRTVDGTAINGEKYKSGEGTIKFGVGEYHKAFKVKLLDDDNWDTTKEFKINLENQVGCELGRYLHTCRVKIIDDDIFPTNKYRKEIAEGEEGIESINGIMLMIEFVRFCFRVVPGVARTSVIIIIGDQVKNLYYLLKTYLISIYMVDVLFAKDPEGTLWGGTKEYTAVLVAFLLGAPMALLHYWDHRKAEMDLAGILRAFLQNSLFQKYFNFDTMLREETPIAEIENALLDECAECVEAGYMKVFSLIALVGKLIIIAGFVLHENRQALFVVIAFPVCVALYLKFKLNDLVKIAEAVNGEKNWVADCVQSACTRFDLIAEYGRRSLATNVFSEAVEGLNGEMLKQDIETVNKGKFPTWLSTIFTCAYIIMFSGQVFDGDLPLGVFIAMVKVFNELGEEIKDAFCEMMELLGAIGPLQKVTYFMNGTTDMQSRMSQCRHCVQQTIEKTDLEKKQKPNLTSVELFDDLQLHVPGDFEFNYAHSRYSALVQPDDYSVHIDKHSYDKSVPLDHEHGTRSTRSPRVESDDPVWKLKCRPAGITLKQGSLISLTGVHGSGKVSCCRLFGTIMFPPKDEPTIFIPSHCRVLHVSNKTCLMDMPLWDNLKLGLIHRDPRRDRVMRIITSMQTGSGILDKQLKKEFKYQALIEELEEQAHKGPLDDDLVKRIQSKLAKEGGNLELLGKLAKELNKEFGDAEDEEHVAMNRVMPQGMTKVASRLTAKVASRVFPKGSKIDELLEKIKKQLLSGRKWQAKLSSADIATIHYARAFIMNPEFMVLDRPTSNFDEATRPKFFKLLQTHIKERGLEMVSPDERMKGSLRPELRRPRTVLFSTTYSSEAISADLRIRLDFKNKNEDGIHESLMTLKS